MEKIEALNARLIDHFGIAWNGWAIFRIVWSEDQFENRLTEYDDKGNKLIFPEIRWLPKYKQYISDKYLIERLVSVPQVNQADLVDKISYEPLFTFEDGFGNPLPPSWEASKFVIDTVLAAQGESSMYAKYVDPDKDNPKEKRLERIEKLEQELFGNETSVGDALAYKQGVTVPSNYKVN